MIRSDNNKYKKKDFHHAMAPSRFEAFVKAMQYDRINMSIETVIAENSYGTGKILVDCFLLPVPNSGVKNSREILIRKYCELHPDEIFTILSANPTLTYADSLVIIGGKKNIR